jgi:MOSC domain-containing protein YiiM
MSEFENSTSVSEGQSFEGEIISICYKPEGAKSPDTYLRVIRESVELVIGRGIRGDRKGRSPRRQLNIMSQETVEQLHSEGYRTAPGELGEQIVISGIDVQQLPVGSHLQLGDSAWIEIFSLREPCDRFAHIQGLPEAHGRVGILGGVVKGGSIKVGDRVRVLQPEEVVLPS